MQEVEPVALATETQQQEHDFVVRGGLPGMPVPFDEEADTDWRNVLRHFHLTGEGARSAADQPSDGPLRPAVLAAAEHLPRVRGADRTTVHARRPRTPGGLSRDPRPLAWRWTTQGVAQPVGIAALPCTFVIRSVSPST